MSERLVTVATFPSAIEANLACNKLVEAGIRAVVTGGESADVLSYVGTAIGGARLEVF
jgi:ADP-ribosylglycohydrolase